jgi:exodeoxyribonuclease VII large subunit
MEDLWCFNEELLARSIAASNIPVISAVGHEIDFTICDFAADLRVPTPSAAAELVIGRYDEINSRLDRSIKDMQYAILNRCALEKSRIERLAARSAVFEPRHLLNCRCQQIDELEMRLEAASRLAHANAMRHVENLATALHTLSPERQLERGYAMVLSQDGKKVITSSRIPPETALQLRFADGEIGVKTL